MKVTDNTNLSCFHTFCYNSEAIEEYYGSFQSVSVIENLSNTHTQFCIYKYSIRTFITVFLQYAKHAVNSYHTVHVSPKPND